MAFKSMEKFPRGNINALADETSHLQVGGITSNFQQCCSAKVKKADNSIPEDVLNSIADKVVEKLTNTTLHSEAGGNEPCQPQFNFAANASGSFARNFSRGYRY